MVHAKQYCQRCGWSIDPATAKRRATCPTCKGTTLAGMHYVEAEQENADSLVRDIHQRFTDSGVKEKPVRE